MTDTRTMETLNAVAALEKAKALIEDPANWCQGAPVLREEIFIIPEASAIAPEGMDGCLKIASWEKQFKERVCASESLCRTTNGLPDEPAFIAKAALQKAAMHMGFAFAHTVNDTLGHAAVMEMYDRAIASLKARIND